MFRMSVHTILLTLSPVVSILVSLLLFGTFPSGQELLGGLFVLAGVALVTRGR
jgi:drug/metabolite transporter (DMT)-like permease